MFLHNFNAAARISHQNIGISGPVLNDNEVSKIEQRAGKYASQYRMHDASLPYYNFEDRFHKVSGVYDPTWSKVAPQSQWAPEVSGAVQEWRTKTTTGISTGSWATWEEGYPKPLPAFHMATMADRKFVNYALWLNMYQNPKGFNKAINFKHLGIGREDYPSLQETINQNLGEYEAYRGLSDPYGQRFTVDMPLFSLGHTPACLRTGWIMRPQIAAPSLTTLFIQDETVPYPLPYLFMTLTHL